MTETRALARQLAAKARRSPFAILDAVAGGLEMSFADAQTYEATLFGLIATTDDMREARVRSSTNANQPSAASSGRVSACVSPSLFPSTTNS
jgi:hypothetical protein